MTLPTYRYRLIDVDGVIVSQVSTHRKTIQSRALALSRTRMTEIRVQKMRDGSDEWITTRIHYRNGQELLESEKHD